jgi:hypothetical protein
MKCLPAVCLLLAMTLSHAASALCGHRAAAPSAGHEVAHRQATNHEAAHHPTSHEAAGQAGHGQGHGGAHPAGEEQGADHGDHQNGHACGALMDCGVVAVAPSADAPSQLAAGSSFVLRHLIGSLESELPPTESPPPRRV